MTDESELNEAGKLFVQALLRDDKDVIDRSIDRLGTWQCVVLLSSLLAVLVREEFGSSVGVKQISEYSKNVLAGTDHGLRQIVVESVLRTGAGYQGSLAGLSDDEILDTTAVVVRLMCQRFGDRSDLAALAERAVDLAREGTIIGE